MIDIVLIFVALAPNMLHHNNIGITCAGASNFRMEPVRSIPLYYVAMLQSMVIVTEVPFVTAPAHTIVGMRSKPQTLWVTQLVSVHKKMPKKVNKVFARQPSYLGGGGSRPKRTTMTSRTFKLFWIADDESKQTTITTKQALSSAT
jgi:hypothetical protein